MQRPARPSFAFVIAAAVVSFVGCAKDPSSLTAADLVGRWRADFDASWSRSKEGFLKDTLRGSAAYSKDPAEKEKQVRDEMKPIVDGIVHEYGADGSLKKTAMGQEMAGRYTVTAKAPSFEVEETAGKKQQATITFEHADSILWAPSRGPTLVLRRAK